MQRVIVGSIFMCMGATFTIFNSWFAHWAADWWYKKALGIEMPVWLLRLSYALGGLCFFVFGLLTVLKIVEFKGF